MLHDFEGIQAKASITRLCSSSAGHLKSGGVHFAGAKRSVPSSSDHLVGDMITEPEEGSPESDEEVEPVAAYDVSKLVKVSKQKDTKRKKLT